MSARAIRLGRMFAATLVGAALLGAMMLGALADAVTAPTGASVDVAPFAAELVGFAIVVFGPALAFALTAGIVQLLRLIGVKITAEREKAVRDKVDQALDRAAAFARARVGASGPITIDLKDERIAAAAGYAMRSIPDQLKKLGIVEETSERLAEMVEARLGASSSSTAA